MATSTKQASSKRRLLLASDRIDRSGELATILRSVSDVDTVTTAEIPLAPGKDFAGVVVDINLRSPESVQIVRNRLRADAYSAMPRLFVLADALHHASMQAWALGATDTIARPLEPGAVLQRIRAAFPDTVGYDASARGKALNRGVEAAHEVITKIFRRLPAGEPLKPEDIAQAETKILTITSCAASTPRLSALPRSVSSYALLSGNAARMRCRMPRASNGREIVSVAPSAQACIEAWCMASANTNNRGISR